MRTTRYALLIAAVMAIAWAGAAAAAWSADFTTSSFNPAVGEIASFAVCEPCLGGGTFQYRWDWNGDGVVDLETTDGIVAHAFETEGFYEIQLAIVDEGGRQQVSRKGILVGSAPALAVRDVVVQSDGAVFVVVTIFVSAPSSAIGFQEALQQGWQVEILDAGGSLTRTNAEARRLEVLWGSAFEPGDTITFSYRLYPGYGTSISRFAGELSGYADGTRFVGGICGDVILP